MCQRVSRGDGQGKLWRVQFRHEGTKQFVGYYVNAEEAAWEQDLKHLELGYEDEGYCNFGL